MNGRLWYPQLDVYDGIRRLGALLMAFQNQTGIELLCIADFYLANPPLLHLTQMLAKTRRSFRLLEIPHPKKTFLTYPAPQLLYKKMEPIQKEALQAMTGTGLLSLTQFNRGVGEVTSDGQTVLKKILLERLTGHECDLIRFLTLEFVPRVDSPTLELRRRTGLRRGNW